ncbi:RHO1 GDP-GTP exchange protein 2 [Candida tropicalis]
MSSSANIPPYNARNNNTNGNNFNHMKHQQHSAVPQQNHQAMNVPEHLLPQAFMNQQQQQQQQQPPPQQHYSQPHLNQHPQQYSFPSQSRPHPPQQQHYPNAQQRSQSFTSYSANPLGSQKTMDPGSPSLANPIQFQGISGSSSTEQQYPSSPKRAFSQPAVMTSPQSGLQQPYVAQRQNDLAGLNQGQYPSKNRSASSLTYDRSYSHHQQGLPQQSSQQHPQPPYPINNGLNGPPQSLSLDPQQPQAPYPQQRRQLRKAPSSNLPPIQNDQVYNSPDARRIVSTPNHQQNFPTPVPLEARTQSLTSMSFKNQQQQQQQQQQAPLTQPPNFDSPVREPSSRSASSSSLHHTFSLGSKSRSFTSISKLSSLSTKKFGSTSSVNTNKLDRHQTSSTIKTYGSNHPHGHHHHHHPPKPSVYPAILSEVAKLFKEAIILTINTKDGLEYHDTFTGKMAVDILCRIIRTNDRNLALLLGRSLDAQKFFHDVTYNHRLRDSVHEVYAFNHVYNDVDFFHDDGNGTQTNGNNSALNSKHGSFVDSSSLQNALNDHILQEQLPSHISKPALEHNNSQSNGSLSRIASGVGISGNGSSAVVAGKELTASQQTGVNGVFTILTECYSPTCSRNRLCYSIACPRRLEQQARLNLKPQGGLQRAVSRLSLHDQEESETLWHKTVPQSVLDKLDKHEKTRQELIYEFVYTERDYVKDLEFMTDFYIMPLRNPANNIIPEYQRETFIQTVFGGVPDLLRLAKRLSEALTRRQQQQKPVVETIGDVFLDYVGDFDPFITYSGNKVFATFEHERQQQVNMKYARFLDAIEKKPESRRQDLSSFLIKGVQRPARYQLLLSGILKHTKPESPDYKYLTKAKEEIEKLLVKINIQTGECTDRHKVMVLHRLLGKQTLENRFNFKLSYNNRIIYQVTLNRKRDNEKIDLYLFEHALLLVKHKIQNKREQHKVFEKPMYLPLLFVNSGMEVPTSRTIMPYRNNMSLVSDTSIKPQKPESTNYIGNTLNSSSNSKFQLNFFGLGSNQVHASLFAEDLAIQNQVLSQISAQQKKLIETNDIFSLSKFETRRFTGNNKINCAVPCYGGKKLLYGTDSGVWVSTVRSISATSNEKICSDPTMVISKTYVSQIEVIVEYSKLLVLTDKYLYEYDLSCTDSLDHVKNTKSGKLLMTHISFFKVGVCDGKLLVIGAKTGSQHSICILEPTNPFDKSNKNKNKKTEIQEVYFSSDPISISFLKTKLCVGCAKGFEILSAQTGTKESILDEADPSLDFATQRETVTPLAIHRLGRDFLLCYSEFVFLINRNGWRTNHDWGIFWEGNPQNVAIFFPYLLSFDESFIEIRDLHTTNLLRALAGENIRFLHSNEHAAMFACEEKGYDIIISIDFLK